MVLRRVICSVILLAAIADFAFGQGYEGRRPRPVQPSNPWPIVDPFPPTTVTACPADSEIDLPARVCGTFTSTTRCEDFCSGGAADEPGYCCRRITQNVHCPEITTRCWNNQKIDFCSTGSCGNGYKCCKQACGRRCVPAQGELYRPRHRGPRPRVA